MIKIPCMLFRGGTSKGPFFLKSALPHNEDLRNTLFLKIMGSPHERQINGIGGGNSLSSKVSIVGISARDDADLDYRFCQVLVNEPLVDTALNCGNMLSAVAPFAIEVGLIKACDPITSVRIYNENTDSIIIATLQTPGGVLTYDGESTIDGVPGTASPIRLDFLNPVGSQTGKLLPTGSIVDNIESTTVSCVDVGVPMVITRAPSMGKTGYESKAELDEDKVFLEKLEKLRKNAAIKMGLGDVSLSTSPKICMVSPAKNSGMITSRYFTPFDCHDSHAVSGALCLGAACLIKGSIAHDFAKEFLSGKTRGAQEIAIEHPSGMIDVSIHFDLTTDEMQFPQASFVRTARPLFEGHVIV